MYCELNYTLGYPLKITTNSMEAFGRPVVILKWLLWLFVGDMYVSRKC